MPGWHDATLKLQDEGKIQLVGILQEQHADRARLFMQWKDMDWPLMVDSLNLLAVEVVPITLLIDEAGMIRYRGDLKHLPDFLALSSPDPMPAAVEPSADAMAAASSPPTTAQGWVERGDRLFLWGPEDRQDEAIEAYERALELGVSDVGPVHFRLGVALRRRADGAARQDGDFQHAVRQWQAALDSNPNQYIWRRRIQQYGPRLQKPYPFYDWVETARRDVLNRGLTPWELTVEPRGAELAEPVRQMVQSEPQAPPRNAERIRLDNEGFIEIETTLVPGHIEPGGSARLHVVLRPSTTRQAHWNNEADGLAVWFEVPPGWRLDRKLHRAANPPELVSDEVRRVEVEIVRPDAETPGTSEGPTALSGYALYYVCEDVRGACLYRRQDIRVPLVSE